jgi:hypothetical protein
MPAQTSPEYTSQVIFWYGVPMRNFASELGYDYTTYSFGYCLYAVREGGDSLSEIYAAGYLPYSGSPDTPELAYMARSARLRLQDWTLNSENRRVYGRFEKLERTITPVSADEGMLAFCQDYFAKRHGDVMPEARLRHILHSGWVTHVATYTQYGTPMAYVWLGRDAEATHFYYSFYDVRLVERSLGLWLMIDLALEARELGCDHLYVGTAYGEKGLYKTNFNGLEWWDGCIWRTDRSTLRARCRVDAGRLLDRTDYYKEMLALF